MSEPLIENILLFTRALHAAGLPMSLSQTTDFCHALELIDMSNREELFLLPMAPSLPAKSTAKSSKRFFNLFWRKPRTTQPLTGQKMPIAPRHNRPKQHRYNLAMLMAQKAQLGAKEIEWADKSGSYSNVEIIQRKQFSEMTAEELQRIKRLIQEMRWQVSLRETRRFTPHKQGVQIDLRRAMRETTKYGGVPLKLSWQSKKIKQRPLILIADISGSMERYSRLALQFFYGVSQSLKQVESFVFGTRLTRITPQLKLKNIDTAVDQAAREVNDWSGGTRIGDSLKIFNQEWSRRVLRRGAIVLIVSDGWERGDTSVLEREMRYLQHRCHRLIWLNPLSGRTGYQPEVEGIKASLPYIDDFLPIHNLQSLQDLADHLTSL